VAAAAIVLYLPTLFHDLVWDDNLLLGVMEGRVRAGGLAGLLLSDFRLYPWEATGYYRPVVMLSLWFDRLLSGIVPFSFHLTNVLLHGLVSALVAVAGRRLTGSATAALLGGLLYAVHPTHVESVAFVSGRTDLWAAAFGMASLLCWLRSRAGAPSRLLPWAAWGGLTFLLACLSKEVAVLLPAVVLAWDAVVPTGEDTPSLPGWWRRNRGWAAAWGLSLAALVALRWGAAGLPPVPGAGSSFADSHMGEALRDWTLIPSMWVQYLRLLALPWPLKIIYTPEHLKVTVFSVAGLLMFAGTATATSGVGSRRVGLFGLLWVGAFLLPVSGVVPLHGAIVAERFLYLPSVGFCMMAGSAAVLLGDRLRSARLATVAAGIAAALCAAGVLSASRPWRDEVTLFTRVVQTAPGAWMAYLNLGKAKADRGRTSEAIALYETAIRIKPDYAEAYFSLGILHVREKRYKEALFSLSRAVVLKPGFSEAHNNLGSAYHDLGQYGKAIDSFRKAVEADPKLGQAWANMGRAYFRLGRYEEASAAFREAVRVWPGDTPAHVDMGFALLRLGKWDEAIASFRNALQRDPSNADAYAGLAESNLDAGRREVAEAALREGTSRKDAAHAAYNGLGILYSRAGSRKEAASAFENAARAKPDTPEYRFNLGLAYRGLGRYPEATRAFAEAVRLSPKNPLYRFELGIDLLRTGDRKGAATEREILKGLAPDLANRLGQEMGRGKRDS
jgi:tetratricopeptide (TPR) repeat protein